jgi:hypothetical protein
MTPTSRRTTWKDVAGRAAFAVVLLGVGLVWTSLSWSPGPTLTDRIAAMPLATLASLDGPTVQEVLFEGRVGARNEVLRDGLVAYERFRRVIDIRGDELWVFDTRVTPPLQIDLADGSIEVAGDFGLIDAEPGEPGENERYDGFAIGAPVLVLGRIAPGATAIEAEALIGGTRETYLQRRTNQRWPLLLAGVVCIVLGATAIAGLIRSGASPWHTRQRRS